MQGGVQAQPPSSERHDGDQPAGGHLGDVLVDDDQAVGARHAGQQRLGAVADRLDDVAAVGVAHDRAVQVLAVAQRRDQRLAGDRLHGAAEQLALAEHQPDRRADEHLEGDQRGHRLAGDADDRDLVAAQPAEALRRAGVHGHLPEAHLAELGERLLHHVEPAAGEGAGDEHQVAAQQLALQHLGEPALVRRQDARPVGLGAGVPGGRGERVAVDVDDLARRRRGADVDQLGAGAQDGDPRPRAGRARAPGRRRPAG